MSSRTAAPLLALVGIGFVVALTAGCGYCPESPFTLAVGPRASLESSAACSWRLQSGSSVFTYPELTSVSSTGVVIEMTEQRTGRRLRATWVTQEAYEDDSGGGGESLEDVPHPRAAYPKLEGP